MSDLVVPSVAGVVDVWFDTRFDAPALELLITTQIARLLRADCSLCESIHEERSLRRVAVPLRRLARSLVVTRDEAGEPFGDTELQILSVLTPMIAVALVQANELSAVRTEADTTRRTLHDGLRRLGHAGTLGVIVTTLDGQILEINQTLAELVGYSREELLAPGFGWATLTPPELKAADARVVADLRTSKTVPLRDKQYICKDGSRVWVMVGSTMLDEASGSVISFVIDVTERARHEMDARRASEDRAVEQRSRALLETAPDALVIVDSHGKIVLVNRQTEVMFGYTRDELIGQAPEILIPERFRAGHPAHRRDYVGSPKARGMGVGLDLVGKHKDDSEIPIEISLSPLETDDGVLVLTAIRDVTDRHRADLVRSRLAALVDSSADAIVGKTLDGTITSWNHSAQDLFGYTPDEAIGQSITILIPADRVEEEAELLDRLRRGEVTRVETTRRRKDGSHIEVSVTSSPIFDPRGQVIGGSKVARDITARRVVERALAAAKDAAEAANRELETFSYSVAHDLRAPLRGIDAFAQFLIDDYGAKLDAEGRDHLDEIRSNTKKMSELIDALLSLSRVTRADLHRERTDLAGLARSVAAQLAETEPGRRVEMVVRAPLRADCDPRLARALITNLLANAWKFTGKVTDARIEVGSTDEPHTFFIRDNGAGFDMAHAKNLFAPFQRMHTVREFPGTGIGLATVQRIVQRHGGRIWAQAAVGAGATFTFYLPPASEAS